jgi:hypothetical protein
MLPDLRSLVCIRRNASFVESSEKWSGVRRGRIQLAMRESPVVILLRAKDSKLTEYNLIDNSGYGKVGKELP